MRLIMATEKTKPKTAQDKSISSMIIVTVGAVANSRRCSKKGMVKEEESIIQ